MMMNEIGVERIRELLSYDRESGRFTWNVAPNGRVAAGSIAGTVTEAEAGAAYIAAKRIFHEGCTI